MELVIRLNLTEHEIISPKISDITNDTVNG